MRLLPVLAVLLSLNSWGCGHGQPGPAASPSGPEKPTVDVALVRVRDLPRRISTVGSLRAVTEATISPQAAGLVTAVPVQIGQRVAKGDLLIQQDATGGQLQLEQDVAYLTSELARLGVSHPDQAAPHDTDTPGARKARATMDNARLEWERSQNLYRANLIPESDLQTAKRNYLTAQADYQSALDTVRTTKADVEVRRSAIRIDEQKLRDLATRAPFDGFISDRNVEVGDYISPGGSAGNSPYLRLTQLDPIWCRLNIPQADAARLDDGQPVEIRTQAWPGRVFRGRVDHINPALDPQTRTVIVDARLENPDGVLKPGLFGTVQLQVGTRKAAPLVPQAALIRGAGVVRVFAVQPDGTVKAVTVELGETRGDWVEIAGGLAGGQKLAVSHLDRLYDGAPVTTGRTVAEPPAPQIEK